MSDRLTDKALAYFCALVELVRKEDDECRGMALDDFLDENVKIIADELCERRAADRPLTSQERWNLAQIRNCIDTNRYDYGILVALLDKIETRLGGKP